MNRGRAAALLLAAITACRDGTHAGATTTSDVSASPPATVPSASAAPSASATSASSASAPDPREPIDPIARALEEATIVSLSPSREVPRRSDAFAAILDGQRPASMSLALRGAPLAWRRPLAFYRLARAIEARVVPPTALRRIAFGELGALLARDAAGLAIARDQAAVQNDGTVDALLATRSTEDAGSAWESARGASIDPTSAAQMVAWDRWASSAVPAPDEDPRLLRGYVEMIALDYLAANVARRRALIAGGAIVLDENAGAFPLRAAPGAVDPLLRRIKRVARFPKGLSGALARLDRGRAAALFTGGPFEAWLLSPRALIELDERRQTLLSLVLARIVERGEASVLSL